MFMCIEGGSQTGRSQGALRRLHCNVPQQLKFVRNGNRNSVTEKSRERRKSDLGAIMIFEFELNDIALYTTGEGT